jgi:hypothetical protein
MNLFEQMYKDVLLNESMIQIPSNSEVISLLNTVIAEENQREIDNHKNAFATMQKEFPKAPKDAIIRRLPKPKVNIFEPDQPAFILEAVKAAIRIYEKFYSIASNPNSKVEDYKVAKHQIAKDWYPIRGEAKVGGKQPASIAVIRLLNTALGFKHDDIFKIPLYPNPEGYMMPRLDLIPYVIARKAVMDAFKAGKITEERSKQMIRDLSKLVRTDVQNVEDADINKYHEDHNTEAPLMKTEPEIGPSEVATALNQIPKRYK